MNFEPQTYEELIRMKRCVELTKYYEVTEEELWEIYHFLEQEPEAFIKGGRQNLSLIIGQNTATTQKVIMANCTDSSIDGILLSRTEFKVFPHYTPSSGSGSSGGSSSNNNNNNNSNSNAGAGLSKTENGDNTGDKEGWEKPQAAGSERRPKENKKEIKKENSVTAASPANKNAENKKTNINADNSANGTESKSNTTKNTSRVKKDSSKSKEEKSEDTAADENINESRITARETKNTDRKKADRSKAKITESPKKENTSEHLKLTGAGTVFTAVGMAKTSHGLGFYNRNDENREKNENINKNNNINDNENSTIRFVHEETVPVNEYPEIQVIRTTGEQDVTILSLNLNGDEIFWHQEGDTLIFDQPITAKENTVKVIAVIDGRRIVHMPIWEF